MIKNIFNEYKNKAFIFIVLAIISYVSMIFLGYDNPIEQFSEALIKIGGGAEIDFSPPELEKEFPIQNQPNVESSKEIVPHSEEQNL